MGDFSYILYLAMFSVLAWVALESLVVIRYPGWNGLLNSIGFLTFFALAFLYVLTFVVWARVSGQPPVIAGPCMGLGIQVC